jgi:ABC-type multidrug transport system fused ATPase/permease subunit
MKFIKHFFFLEVDPLIKKGRLRPLEEVDMLPLHPKLDPRNKIFDETLIDWSSPFKNLFSLLKISKSEILPAYGWYLLSTLLSLATPILVHHFVELISKGVTKATMSETLLTAFLLGICGIGTGLFLQHFFYHALMAYQIITNIYNEKIFKHSLKLSLEARQENQIGDVVNYMSSDSDSIADFTFVFGDVLTNTILMIGVVIMLFHYLGISALVSILVMAIMVPFTKKIAKRFTRLDEEMMQFRDKRVTLMTEAMNAIRIVKYFAWEDSIESEVMDVRNNELARRKKLARSEVLSGIIFLTVSTVVLFTALATHAYRGEKLDAALIFTCVSLFALLDGPIGEMSHHLSRITNAFVGSKRVIHFLSTKEKTLIPSLEEKDSLDKSSNHSLGVELIDASGAYGNNSTKALSNINFKLSKGESMAIIGAVGSGKTSLLYLILNEINRQGGSILFEGSENRKPKIAFVPQEAYIINSTLEENIIFGENVLNKSLEEAIFVSALDKDLKFFRAGLKTEIGEKGVNLSGGQKQRVGLARAFVSNADLYLLDDPLSAVDSETEDQLCDNLLFGALKNKTRIVVTHRLKHLNRFDKILFLENGQVKAFGHFDELKKDSIEFNHFYSDHLKSVQHDIHDVAPSSNINLNENKTDSPLLKDEERITEDEDREIGAVKKDIYLDYIKSLGGDDPKNQKWILLLLFAGAIILASLPLLQKSWLSYYSSHQSEWNPVKAMGIYGLIGIGVLVLGVVNNFFWLERGILAGKMLHDKMLKSVLKAPIRFFDSTPVGRIIQRFSRDVESVDIHLQWSFVAVVNCILQVAMAITLILTMIPLMLIVIMPLLIFYYIFQRDYRSAAREAKRFDSVARSPRFAHFKETLQGLTVIRSYSKEEWFLESFYERLSKSQQMFYSHYMLNRWFSTRIPLVGGLISMFTAIGITLSAYYGHMSAGTAGLVTLYSLSFWGYLNWGVRVFADIESRMTSVERLKFFASLPSENYLGELDHLDSSWPSKGEIEVKNISVRYAKHLPLVLKNLSFNIKGGTKVGIIGRTGSGKSTLFQTLFRFIELEEGLILIDGIDIKKISLTKLRKGMAIIPQDPTLFMGTVRSNLDRYNEYSDSEILNALMHAGLLDFIQAMPDQIYTKVTESGHNFSQGQRQLLCLARALLTRARIIVMDEATASVDVHTDNQIQRVIKDELKDVTLLIIAHRLGTVSDCDQIIEIKNGERV